MVCKNTISSMETKIDKKTNSPVKTYRTTRKCSQNAAAIEEEEQKPHPHNADDLSKLEKELEKPEKTNFLEDYEIMVYPEHPLNEKPRMVDIVVMDERTKQRYRKKVPLFALQEIPDEEMIKHKLGEDTKIEETFKRWKELI